MLHNKKNTTDFFIQQVEMFKEMLLAYISQKT